MSDPSATAACDGMPNVQLLHANGMLANNIIRIPTMLQINIIFGVII